MITKFTCDCGNNDPQHAKEYDGCLGYSALVCTICGAYYDYSGKHDPDEWSEQFVEQGLKSKLRYLKTA